jgi:hypothetical protein
VAMLAIGAAYFLVTMAPAVDPAWRAMDDRPEPPPPADPAGERTPEAVA